MAIGQLVSRHSAERSLEVKVFRHVEQEMEASKNIAFPVQDDTSLDLVEEVAHSVMRSAVADDPASVEVSRRDFIWGFMEKATTAGLVLSGLEAFAGNGLGTIQRGSTTYTVKKDGTIEGPNGATGNITSQGGGVIAYTVGNYRGIGVSVGGGTFSDASTSSYSGYKAKGGRDDPLSLYKMAIHHDGSSNWSQAISFYEKLIQISSNDYDLHLRAGSCNVRLKKFDEALRHFQKASDIMPGAAKPYKRMAGVYRAQGNDAKVQEVLAKIKK